MAVRENLDEIMTSSTVPDVDSDTADAATVSAMLDEHARLRSLLKDAIAATPASGEGYWVGVGIDEVVVRGESPETVMAGIEAGVAAGGAVVLEFVSSEPRVIIL